MSPVVTEKSVVSLITLAVFEDLGLYVPRYAAAEQNLWMQQAGCGVFEEPCDTLRGGHGSYFCFEENKLFCTYDHRDMSFCEIQMFDQPLSFYNRYFSDPRKGRGVPYMDGCPMPRQAAPVCQDATSQLDSLSGQRFGLSSRCFETSEDVSPLQLSKPTDSIALRCLEMRCAEMDETGTPFVQFRVGDVEKWISCPTDGSEVEVSLEPHGYRGVVKCMRAVQVCPDRQAFHATVARLLNYRQIENAGQTVEDGDYDIYDDEDSRSTRKNKTSCSVVDAPSLAMMTGAMIGLIISLVVDNTKKQRDEGFVTEYLEQRLPIEVAEFNAPGEEMTELENVGWQA